MSNIYEFHSVSKYYNKKVGVEDIELSIPQNETTIFVGKNGAGKTTTIKLMLGLLHATKGNIIYLDKEYSYESGNRRVGFLPELMHFPEQLTIKELLMNFAQMRGANRKKALETVEYYVEKMNLTDSFDRVIRNLSKGMRQKVGIIQSFIHNPEVLILDEPTSGLDPESRMQLFDLIRETKKKGKTFVISTHNLDEIEHIADNVVFFSKGKIIEKTDISAIKEVSSAISIRTKSAFDMTSIDKFKKYIDIENDCHIILKAEYEDVLNNILSILISSGIKIKSVAPQSVSLQDYFIKLMKGVGDK